MIGGPRRIECAVIGIALAGSACRGKPAERRKADLRPHRTVLCFLFELLPRKDSQGLVAGPDREVRDVDIRGHMARIIYADVEGRSEEHTSELQSLMRISYAVFCL